MNIEQTMIGGKSVSRIGLGTWAIGGSEWGNVPEEEAVAAILSAVDRGINLIDTAPIYGHGHSEEVLGRAIRQHGNRDAFYIATKTGLNWSRGGCEADSTPARLRTELEDSLRRLAVDHIDLYQVHWPDTRTPIAETAGQLKQFVTEGKVRTLGVSNFSIEQMVEFQSVAPLASNQPPYNIFEREIEHRHGDAEAVLPWCAANDIRILTYSPLCRSLLGGRVRQGVQFEAGDIRQVDPKFQQPRFSQYLAAVERLESFARERYGRSVLQLAARWVLDRHGVSVVLWGAKRPAQLDALDGVFGWNLDAAAMAEIDRIVAECVTDPVGPEYLTPDVRRG